VNDATAYTLQLRLHQVCGTEVHPGQRALTESELSDAIRAGSLEGCVCARVPAVGGKIASFENYFRCVYRRNLDGTTIKERKSA
jgi:hypothetical protein